MGINEANIRKRKTLYSEIYAEVLERTMAEYSPYQKAVDLLDDFFVKFKIPENLKCQTISGILTAMCQTATTSSQATSIQLLLESDKLDLETEKLEKEIQLLTAQIGLAQAEQDLTRERIKLVKAQTEAELAKKPLIEREMAVYDDNLRVKEAEILKDLASGYLIGGVEVPSGLHQAVMNKIDLISNQS
ncbi:hypothetical protein OFN70_07405 [Campylobacter sp. CN_NE3]|uniref:hypothetical protein n=1 Tax=Campylobacter sp. CN_NE3 TaxID=2984149 RepID=UPI0022E9D754|nr:hypothetical protein [Campylobacter sp. CN_NE3]MDA3069350.1 hypothetical protein [Campylobacter sp. CN_NE3]